jgi:hypothetical protein
MLSATVVPAIVISMGTVHVPTVAVGVACRVIEHMIVSTLVPFVTTEHDEVDVTCPIRGSGISTYGGEYVELTQAAWERDTFTPSPTCKGTYDGVTMPSIGIGFEAASGPYEAMKAPCGVPFPVGPSYPGTAVQRYVPQGPLAPVVTSQKKLPAVAPPGCPAYE